MVGIVELEHAFGVVGELFLAEVLVAVDHDRERVAGLGRLRIGFHDRLGAVRRSDVRVAPQIEHRDVQVGLRHQVAQVHHALARILGVGALRIARDQRAEIVERLAQVGLVALGHVLADIALDEAGAAVEVDQTAQVVRVVDVLVGRVGLDEAVDRRVRIVGLVVLVLRIGEIDLRLLGIRPKRKARDQPLERARGEIVVAGVDRIDAVLVELLDRQRIHRVAALAAVEQRAAGDRNEQRQQREPDENANSAGNSHADRGSAMIDGR